MKRQSGFTIIEVVLVLAIAGLIFLIVFLALPQLQKSRRDTQRKNDVGRIMTLLTTYASTNSGNFPYLASEITAFRNNYLSNSEIKDPTTGSDYNFSVNTGRPSTTGNVYYLTAGECKTDGGLQLATGAGKNQVALTTKLENGGYLCQTN